MNDLRYEILEVNYMSNFEEDDSVPKNDQIKPFLKGWNFVSIGQNKMILKLIFENPIFVSSFEKKDILNIRVKKGSFFQSKLDNHQLQNNFSVLNFMIPSQAKNKEDYKSIVSITSQISSSVITTLVVPAAFMVFMSVSMNTVWSMYMML